jgi:nicotinamidase-related amidase
MTPRKRPQREGLIHRQPRPDTALLIVDMISAWDFPDAAPLLRHAARIAEPIARLRRRLARAGVPVVYVNDNYGHWRSDFRHVVQMSMAGPGARVTEQIAPDEEDYFVLKPKHSAFFATPLELLLDHLGARRLVLVGLTSDQCIAHSAADARVRDFEVVVPRDCVATLTPARQRRALAHLAEVLAVATPLSTGTRPHAAKRAGAASQR